MASTSTIYRVTEQDQVPGPGQYPIPSDIGNAQKYTIKHRFREHPKSGPGYENIPTTIGEGKKWSLHGRPKEKDITPGPGPNYIPPKFGSDAKSSGFHIRKVERVNRDGPGPGKYDTSGQQSNNKGNGRHWTLKARNFVEDARRDGPGPKYMPNYEPTLPSARKSTIYDVIRRKDSNDVPGPGKYEIDRNPQSRPMSLHQRCGSVKYNDVPGPGKYEPEKYNGGRKASPAFSLRSRIDIPDRSTRAPYQKLPDDIGKDAPSYSLSSRRDLKPREPPPGPSYMPPPFGSDGRKYSLTSRREKKRDPSKEPPGPGQYDITYKTNNGRKYTLKGRNFWPEEGKAVSPGPAYMPEYENVLPSPRKITIREKIQEPKPKAAPGYYNLGTTVGEGPKITIGNKEKLAVRPGLE